MACTKADLFLVVYPNFWKSAQLPGDVFGLATGNALPHVNLTLLERIGVGRVGNM